VACVQVSAAAKYAVAFYSISWRQFASIDLVVWSILWYLSGTFLLAVVHKPTWFWGWLMPYSDPEVRRVARRRSYQNRKERILEKEKYYRHVNPTSKRQIQYKRRYGITIEQFDDMRKAQNNCCAICREEFKPVRLKLAIHVDHCHDSLKVRGLLCARCNVGIGLLGDSVDRLREAIAYLQRE